jgi:hypothetical protein
VRAVALAGLALMLLGCPGSQIGCVEALDTSASHLTFTTTKSSRSGCLRNPLVDHVSIYAPHVAHGWSTHARPPQKLPPVVTYGVAPPGFTDGVFPDGTTVSSLQPGMTVQIWISGPHMVGGADVTLTE